VITSTDVPGLCNDRGRQSVRNERSRRREPEAVVWVQRVVERTESRIRVRLKSIGSLRHQGGS